MKIYKKGLRIVMADDDEDDRMMFSEAIQSLRLDCRLEFCVNGEELLKRLDDSGSELPDLVFLDLNMPILNGFEALARIRSQEAFNEIPIVTIYSTSSDLKDKRKSLETGADAYIVKPTDFNELKRILEAVIMKDWAARAEISLSNFVIGAPGH